jgi:LuxR family transcriptional regulator, maltose regulon positive regulatory protein
VIDRSKLQIPALPRGVIDRRRLSGILDFACIRPVTVLEAPAGFGKTTALLNWLARSERPVAWLTLDRFDNDPRRLARHIFAALDSAVPGLGSNSLRASDEGADILRKCVALLERAAQELALEDMVFVLDDFHVLTEDDCQGIIRACVLAIMDSVQTVLTSRSRPYLRLRTSDSSTITAAELAFRPEETRSLLNGTYGLGLDERELRELDFKAQGWPVGLSLLGTSRVTQRDASTAAPIERQFASLGRGALADYVVQEILDHLDAPVREFLLKSSILQRLRGDLCEAVLHDPDAPRLLEELRASSHVILEFGGDHSWVRIHELVRSVMMQRLLEEEPALAAELHHRAALWFTEHNLIPEAIDHAISAGDGLFAAETIAGNAVELIHSRQYRTLRRALAAAPAERGELQPVLEALDITIGIRTGSADYATAQARARNLAAANPERIEVLQMTDNVLMDPLLGDIAGAVTAGRKALERDRSDPSLGPQRAVMLAQALWFAGDFAAIRQLAEPHADVSEPLFLAVWGRGLCASAHAVDGDLRRAERMMREALEMAAGSGSEIELEFPALPGVFAEILRASGKLGEARAQIDEYLRGRELAWPRGMGHGLALAIDARVAVAERSHKHAAASARKARAIIERFPDPGELMLGWLDQLDGVLATPSAQTLTGTRPTAAEMRVLMLLAEGFSRGEIAERLFLSDSTVKSHLRRLYRRLDVSSREHALAAAHERGLA